VQGQLPAVYSRFQQIVRLAQRVERSLELVRAHQHRSAEHLLLGSLMYRSRLVPRIIPAMGLVAAPLLIASVFATLFGGIKLGSPCSPPSRWLPGSSRWAYG
jgi:Domain of unknown function (DUF4386)